MKLQGEIVVERPLAVLFKWGPWRVWLPKSTISRLVPNTFRLGPRLIFIPREVAESKFGGGQGYGEPGEAVA